MNQAIIIGATSGIGKEVATRLLEQGWRVGVAGRREQALAALQESYGTERVVIAPMDVITQESVEKLDDLLKAVPSPDLFLYMSGVGYQNVELDEEKELRTVRTNCEGMVRMVDHFLNYVKSNRDYSASRKAHVAVVTSVAGTAGMGSAPAYSATKRMQSTYLSALSQWSRMERVPVVFTDIKPGFVATDILNPDKHYPMLMDKEKAASHVLKAIRKRKRVYVFDWRFRVLVFFWRLVPRCLWERVRNVRS